MGLQMASPSKRKGSKFVQFRRGTPKDILRAKDALAAYGVKVPKEVTASLRCTDDAEAKRKFAALSLQCDETWQGWRDLLRDGPRKLTQKEIFAVVSEMTRDVRQRANDNPGDAGFWQDARRIVSAFAANPEASGVADDVLGFYRERIKRHLAMRYGWAAVAPESLEALLKQFLSDLPKVAEALGTLASGDYREPDWLQGRPRGGAALVDVPKATARPVTFTSIIEHWIKQRGPSPASIRAYRSRVRNLTDFLGHENAGRITDDDVRRWRDGMIEAGKRDAETIRDHLAAVSSLLRHAVENKLLGTNAAAAVKLRKRLDAGTRKKRRSYTDAEARRILAAARRKAGFLRWGPWIMAYTAMRVGEVAQLRKVDVLKDSEGNLSLRIDPAAGRVKWNRERIVPVHPVLIAEGFAIYAASIAGARLFPELYADRAKADDPEKLKNYASKVMREWVRGSDVGITDLAVGPAHSWRHHFNTRSREHDMERDARKAIAGHLDDATSAHYGETTAKAARKQLGKLPPIIKPQRQEKRKGGPKA